MSSSPEIECSQDGPYLVRHLEDLRDPFGAPMETKPMMALCRCGGSTNKPFCDGTHKKNGFSGAKQADASADQRDSYVAQRITIHDNRAICAHSGRCTESLASVFKYGSEPWIDPSGAEVEAIIKAIHNCPSGALSYTLDGIPSQDQGLSPSINLTRDGPYAVIGPVKLFGQSCEQGAATEHYTLCRCGGSKNKPFCDGSHWSLGFKA